MRDYSADSEVFDLKGPQLSPYITSNTIFKNSAAAAAQGALMIVINGVFHFKTLRQANFYQIHNGIKDTGRAMIANIGYGDSWYAMWGAGSSGYWDSNGNELPDLKAAMNGRIYWTGDLQDELQDHNGAGKEITVTKWNDNTRKTFDKIFEGKGSTLNQLNKG